MTKLNDFALWADEVTDAEALREAEAYLQELKDSPTVTERLRKAMAIAIGSMIFGEDFEDATIHLQDNHPKEFMAALFGEDKS